MLDLRFAAALVLLVAPARLAGSLLTRWHGADRSTVADVAWWGGAAFVVAGRVAWLAMHPQTLRYPVDVIRLTQGMITSVGVVGVVVALVVLARRRHLALADVAMPGALMAAVAHLGWQAGCGLRGSCGGVVVQLGPLERAPVALGLALVSAAAVAWLVGAVRAGRTSLGRPLAAVGVLLVAQAGAGRWQLRLAEWPAVNDIALLAEGIGLLVAGAAAVRSTRP